MPGARANRSAGAEAAGARFAVASGHVPNPAGPWRIADERPTLGPGDLHVWRHDLDGEHDEPAAAAILSESERSRAARLVFERDRRRFRAGRLALRGILSRYVGHPAASLALATRADGKPYLVDFDIEFNVSHSHREWICAVASRTPVGVDVEELRVVPNCLSLARHHFSRVEADALAAVPAEHRDRAFLACWTRKEAYLKVLGLGISADLGAFVAGFGPDDVTLAGSAPESSRDVHLRTFSPGPGAIGALGFMEKPNRIEYFVAPAAGAAHEKGAR